jgi:hypothetical protein
VGNEALFAGAQSAAAGANGAATRTGSTSKAKALAAALRKGRVN